MLIFVVTNLYCVSSRADLSCKSACPLTWIGDGVCNQECMNLGCGFDSLLDLDDNYLSLLTSDCSTACSCDEAMLTNDVCDPECNIFQCGFDLGVCGYCASGCFIEDLESDFCIEECFNDLCKKFDTNPCFYCAPGCLIEDLKTSCILECFHENCSAVEENYCKNNECPSECSLDFLGNNECHPMCNNAECFYDFGDCECSKGCSDTFGECLTNSTYTDPCDTESCEYKDGKCGYCASGCFESDLGNGTCESECNNEACNYDNGDCGCASNCSFKYDSSLSKFIQAGSSYECSLDCLVLGCRFGIDFCPDKVLIKMALFSFMMHKDSEKTLDLSDCYKTGCSSGDLYQFAANKNSCYENEACDIKECLYCMGSSSIYQNYCLKYNAETCFTCLGFAKLGGACIMFFEWVPWYEEDPGFTEGNFTELVQSGSWYFKEAVQYSTSFYKEIFVTSSAPGEEFLKTYSEFQNLYIAFHYVYADYTKIYILDKETDYFLSFSRLNDFTSEKDPLLTKTSYKTYELWIIGNYSTEEKTIVYWKDNLLLTSLTRKLYIKNIEFIGKYNIDKNCLQETCYYCPYIIQDGNVYKDDKGLEISYLNLTNYSKDCSKYSSINVFNVKYDAYIEDVNFVDFRYQFNSLITYSGNLYLKNVNFDKIQAKSDGSVIFFDCNTNNCLKTSFIYNQGQVRGLGAGNNDGYNVTTGSFFKSTNIGYITISNVTFSFNFVHHNRRSLNNGYLFYSKNHLGTIVIEDCVFQNNYVDHLVYVDVSKLDYKDYRIKQGISKSYSQQHFLMNKIKIMETYCSISMIYYLMANLAHNIKITDLQVNSSIAGDGGVLLIVHSGNLKNSDIKREFINFDNKYIQLEPRKLELIKIYVYDSCTGKNILNIQNFPNIYIENISISNITDCNINNMNYILSSFVRYDPFNLVNYVHPDNLPDLNCSQTILLSNSVNLLIESMSIEKINCGHDSGPSGLSLNKIIGSTLIKKLYISDIVDNDNSGLALTVTESNSIKISDMSISNLINFKESIIYFDNCDEISIDLARIYNVESNYFSPFIVANSLSFTLSNFEFKNMKSIISNGGCISLLTGILGASYNIQSGIMSECNSINSTGGGIFLNSISKLAITSFEISNLEISNCQSDEGSAIFISNSVIFGNKKESILANMLIINNTCEGGGIISDYHNSGTLKFNNLEMKDNNYGIYIFYSNSYPSLKISNAKIYASSIVSSVIYLSSLISRASVLLEDVEIYDASVLALEAYNFKLFIKKMIIGNSTQAFYLNNKVTCEANELSIFASTETAIAISKSSMFTCSNCDFTKNSNSIIEAFTESNFTLVNSKIFSNTLATGHLLYVSSTSSKENFLISCFIHSNIIARSIIYLISTFFTLQDCSFINNYGNSYLINVIYTYDTILSIYNSKIQFNSNLIFGAFLFAEFDSIVTVENTTFENSSSTQGNINVRNSKIYLINCKFSNNTGEEILTEFSSLTLINCEFENTLLRNANLGVVVLKSSINSIIEVASFKNISPYSETSRQAYIYSSSSEKLEINNCSLNGSDNFMMAVFIEATNLTITNSDFKGFKTKEYSVLTAISDTRSCEFRIYNSSISENWSSKSGGGVYSENCNLIIENTDISLNSAQDSGGGVYFSSPYCDYCGVYLFGDTKIFENSCKGDGGAIKWKDFKPYIEKPLLIYNNSAAYGSNFASVPASFGLSPGRRLSDSIITTLSDIPPGKKYTEIIQIFIYDTYGQVVETENSITTTLIVNETIDSLIAISGITTFKAQEGVINITDFTLTGEPGSSAYLKLKSDNMISSGARNDETIYINSAYIKVEFRNCSNGEQIQASACVDCFGGKYTLKASQNCLDCPTGASCTGGDTIIVKNGFWRSSLESDVIYACDVFDACLKGTETNELGNCSSGYSGVLCKSCEIGYLKTANGICAKCPNERTNIISVVLLCLGIISISFVLVKTTLTSAFSPKALHSIYIKIFTNYLQLVFIVTQFDLEWPSYVTEFFNVQRSTASVSDQLFSFDCYIALRDSGNVEYMYYTKLCMISGLPIVVITLSYLYWVFYSFIQESYRWLKREVFTTIIALFFLVYPTVVKVMFSNFSCVDIDKMQSYLNENTAIECWDSNHKKFSYIVVVPSIIIWVVGIPTILLILMTKNRRRLHLDYYRVVYGFLYNGYKQNRFYWEINIMYRKILLITITVFKISQARVLQALNLIIVLLASIYLHHSYRPYNSSQLNNMEMQALNIAAITIYFGLYYLSRSISEAIKILLFICIILGNSYFISYWIYFMGRALIDIFIKFFPRFKSLLKRGDAFDEEFYKEELKRKGVFYNPLEGKNAFTFINFENQNEEESFKYRNIEEAFKDVAERDIKRQKIIKGEDS